MSQIKKIKEPISLRGIFQRLTKKEQEQGYVDIHFFINKWSTGALATSYRLK